MSNDGFELMLASPAEYDRLVAEIFHRGKFVALISQERGERQFDVELPGCDVDDSEVLRKVEVHGFVAAIELACRRLSESSKGPTPICGE